MDDKEKIKEIFEQKAKEKRIKVKEFGITCICGELPLSSIPFTLKEIREILRDYK